MEIFLLAGLALFGVATPSDLFSQFLHLSFRWHMVAISQKFGLKMEHGAAMRNSG